MPLPARQSLKGVADGTYFVDRLSEAEALREALSEHRRRIDNDEIDTVEYRNVLMFYGGGGTGKTAISTRLALWLASSTADTAHWGSPPVQAVAAVCRWELNDSQGGLDPWELLLGLRRAFGEVRREWPAFDIAFTLFTQSVHRSDDVPLSRPKAESPGLLVSDVVAGAISDVATLADVAGGGLAAPGVSLIVSVLSKRRQSQRTRRLLQEWGGLGELLRDCQAFSGSHEEMLELTHRIGYQLSLAVDRLPPRERPIVVVFVDHFERLQHSGAGGEAIIQALVLALPFVLFVVTGRESLTWADPARTDLPRPGPRTWPGLVLSDPPAAEPRQHLVDNLGAADAVRLLRTRMAHVGAQAAPGVIEALAERTGGWPLHLDSIVTLASQHSGERELTLQDLGGPLPAVVNRLFQGLDAEEKEVFQAACLLPFFDARLAAEAARTSVGSAMRFIGRSIVAENPGSPYPYRIHDDIRRIVRITGSESKGGWSEEDRSQHAKLAIAEAQRRFEVALEEQQDQAAIHALALALTLAAENDAFNPWLLEGLRRSPSLRGLAALVPLPAPSRMSHDLAQTLAFVQASGLPISEAKLNAVTAVENAGGAVFETAALWRAYTLRSLGRWDEAIQQFESLLAGSLQRRPTFENQLVVTFRFARRFREAMDHIHILNAKQQRHMEAYLRWRHGYVEGVPEIIAERSNTEGSSRRFAVELAGSWLVALNQAGRATIEDVERVERLGAQVGHLSATANAIGVRAMLHLFDDEVVTHCLEDMATVNQQKGTTGSLATQVQVLRGWALSREDLIDRAHQDCLERPYRDSGWIGVECLLDHLGRAIPATPGTTFLEPYDTVRDRWVQVFAGIVARAPR